MLEAAIVSTPQYLEPIMSSPVEEYSPPNPFHDHFHDPFRMTDSPADTSKDTSGVISSAEGSRPQSRGPSKKRVGFAGGTDSAERSARNSWVGPSNRTLSPPSSSPQTGSPGERGANTPDHSRQGSGDGLLRDSKSHLPELSPQQTQEIYNAFEPTLKVPARPIIRRISSNAAVDGKAEEAESPDDDRERSYRRLRAREAFDRGKRLEQDERIYSEPNSRYASPERPKARIHESPLQDGDIPMEDLRHKHYDDDHDTDSEDGLEMPSLKRAKKAGMEEAHKLVRKHTVANAVLHNDANSGIQSGAVTPTEETEFFEDYKPRPDRFRGGILGALLKMYNHPHESSHRRSSSVPRAAHLRHSSADLVGWSATPTPQPSPPGSGTTTPRGGRHWYSPKRNQSTSSLAQLIGSSASLGSPVVSGLGEQVSQRLKEQREQERRPGLGKRAHSSGALKALNRLSRPRLEDEIRITVHIAETINRQRYLMKLCKALMQYGAPTHRLEEYMKMSARVLEIDAQFLYIPGSMLMSFDDASTHTTEVKLVKVAQGLDLGKLRDVHEVYKDVVHDRIGVDEATTRLKETTNRKQKHNKWVLIPVYGMASVCVGPFAFGARLIDLPISFILGCILGLLQLVIAPRSDLYANVFEIAAAVITSFLARAFGSINHGNLFCFSALAQSSIALILPGYTVLCASLELQSRSIVAGSVRMVYAIIYSLFLGFGITIGTAIYGIMDKNATSSTSCQKPMPKYWFFFFVPAFTMCLIVINQAKWKQAPVMMVIAFTGYLVNFFSSERFAGNTQVSNTLGALAIGVLANSYSRVGSRLENMWLDLWEDKLRPHWRDFRRKVLHIKSKAKTPKKLEEGHVADNESLFVRQTRRVGYGLAAAAMLPAIFVQVPSGLAVSGSLVSGIASADQITGNATNGTTVVNSTTLTLNSQGLNSIAFNVGYSVIQVAIGITVGLFLSAIVVYPFGKKRSGLFSF